MKNKIIILLCATLVALMFSTKTNGNLGATEKEKQCYSHVHYFADYFEDKINDLNKKVKQSKSEITSISNSLNQYRDKDVLIVEKICD